MGQVCDTLSQSNCWIQIGTGGRTAVRFTRFPHCSNPSPISIPPCVILTDFAAAEEDIQLKIRWCDGAGFALLPMSCVQGFLARARVPRARCHTGSGTGRACLLATPGSVPERAPKPISKQQTERRNTTWPRFSESTSERPTAAWPSWKAASPSSSPTRRATARRPPSSRSPSPASASSARPPSARPSPTPRTPSSRSSASWAAATTRWPTRSRRSPTRSSAPPTATPR